MRHSPLIVALLCTQAAVASPKQKPSPGDVAVDVFRSVAQEAGMAGVCVLGIYLVIEDLETWSVGGDSFLREVFEGALHRVGV